MRESLQAEALIPRFTHQLIQGMGERVALVEGYISVCANDAQTGLAHLAGQEL
jgi:hypothetical protein